MTTKKLLLFFFFCAYLAKIDAYEYEDNMKAWFREMRRAHFEECKHTISVESFQELDDDWEADNGEIRAWRTCILIKRKFIVDNKIDDVTIVNDGKRYFSNLNPFELQTVQNYVRICKTEADQYETLMEVTAEFISCAMDRIKTIS